MIATVLIATKDRPEHLRRCIDSLLQNDYREKWEIIILDQGVKIDDYDNEKKIRYFSLKKKGKSEALNFGLKKAWGEVVMFTDDDCIVDKNWLKNTLNFLGENKDVAGVFGNVRPYNPENNTNKYCPSTFISSKDAIISNIGSAHFLTLGSGNNMAFFKKKLLKIGGFTSWMGPGKLILTGEDGDLVYRFLKNGYKLASCPKILVWHNRWLTDRERETNSSLYTRGLAAMSGYYWENFSTIRKGYGERWKFKLKDVVVSAKTLVKEVGYLVWETLNIILGVMTGLVIRIWELFF